MEDKMNRNISLIGLLAVFFLYGLSGSLFALEGGKPFGIDKEEQEVFLKAKQFVYERKWSEAVKALEQYLPGSKEQSLTAEARYWLAYSLNKNADDADESDLEIELKQKAFKVLSELIQRYPDNRWVKDSRFLSVEIAEDLVELGLSSYKKYLTNASHDDQNTELKLVALDALLQMNRDKAFPILERIIRSNEDYRMRVKALFVLSQSDHPRRVPLLLEAAQKDSHPDVREKAIFWLGQTESKEALKALKELYHAVGSVKLREKIIFPISQQNGIEAVQVLIALYRSETSLELKKKIIFRLGQMEHDEARKFIESLLQ